MNHECLNVNGGLASAPLNLGHGWVTTSHCFMWMELLIRGMIFMLIQVIFLKGGARNILKIALLTMH